MIPAATVCHIDDPRLTEASGLVASTRDRNVYFTHNDSGDSARFFAVDTSCRVRAEYDLPGASATDWEDIARGPGPDGKTVVWLGDIGDNRSVRSSVTVYAVAQPAAAPARQQLPWAAYRFTYPDGAHDAETLLADPSSGRLYIITKSLFGPCGVYEAPATLSTAGENTLTKVATLDEVLVTGGDISPDGKRLALRTYADVSVGAWTPEDLQLQQVPGPVEEQGEAVAWSPDGKTLWFTSEGKDPPLDREAAPAEPTPSTAPSTSPVPSASPSPSASARPASRSTGNSDLPRVLLAAVGVLALLIALGRWLTSRRGGGR